MAENSSSQNPPKKTVTKKTLRHRRFFAVIILLVIVWWFNNFTVKITEQTVKSPKISASVRIAVVSDMHATDFGISVDSIVSKMKKTSPDIIIELGDMYTTGSSQELMDKPVELTKKLVDEGFPVYFVNGEHDTDRKYIKKMAEAGAHVMNYESETITVNGNRLRILGIDNVYYSGTFDLSNEFTLDDSCFNILLAHIPNYEKFARFGADLTLCADTHGGMIQLPFDMGPVYHEGNWFPQLKSGNTVYDKGCFDYKNGTMFITSGIGNSPVPARFNNRPEIAVIELIPE